jgi:uncharacterized membrane protein YgcG
MSNPKKFKFNTAIKLSVIVIAAAMSNLASAQTAGNPCSNQTSEGCVLIGPSAVMTVAATDSSTSVAPSTTPTVDTVSAVVPLLEGGRGGQGSPGAGSSGGNSSGSG